MQYVLSGLMSMVMAAHAVMGCCWHHGHDADACEQPVAVASHGCSHDHGCSQDHSCHHGDDHHKAAGDSAPHSSNDGCTVECCETCRFLPAKPRFQLDPPTSSHLDMMATVGDAFAAASTSPDAAIVFELRTLSAPPVRLHLAHCLLLI